MAEAKSIVYSPYHRQQMGIWGTARQLVLNLYANRDLATQLFKRDFMGAYKKSFFGMTWHIISPLLSIATWVYLNRIGIMAPGDLPVPYPAYLLMGILMWGGFAGFVESVSKTLTASRSLIIQIGFPHEILLFKQCAQHMATFGIGFMLNVGVLLILGVVPSWKIVFLPMMLIPMALLGAAMGLILAPIAAVSNDVDNGLRVFMSLLMISVPIVYFPSPSSPLHEWLQWNPLTHLVCSCRDVVLMGTFSNPILYGVCALGSLGLFMAAWRIFFMIENRVVERMV